MSRVWYCVLSSLWMSVILQYTFWNDKSSCCSRYLSSSFASLIQHKSYQRNSSRSSLATDNLGPWGVWREVNIQMHRAGRRSLLPQSRMGSCHHVAFPFHLCFGTFLLHCVLGAFWVAYQAFPRMWVLNKWFKWWMSLDKHYCNSSWLRRLGFELNFPLSLSKEPEKYYLKDLRQCGPYSTDLIDRRITKLSAGPMSL